MNFTIALALAALLAQDTHTTKKSNSSTATAGDSESTASGKTTKAKVHNRKKTTVYRDTIAITNSSAGSTSADRTDTASEKGGGEAGTRKATGDKADGKP